MNISKNADARWNEWKDYASRILVSDRLTSPSPSDAVRLLTDFGAGLHSLRLIRSTLKQLGVNVRPRGSSRALNGQGRFTVRTREGLLFRSDYSEVDINATGARGAFVAAHELAHVVLYTFITSGNTCASFRSRYEDYDEAELFCDEFARLAVGIARDVEDRPPASLLLELNRTMDTWGVLGEEANSISRSTGMLLTFPHILRLARLNQKTHGQEWSISRTIAWLNKSEFLDAAEAGIVVMRILPNRKTQLTPALRIWSVSLPAWAYVPVNQRVYHRGFLHAQEAYDRIGNRKVWPCRETLHVKENTELLSLPSRTRFVSRLLDTTCAYTPIDVAKVGRFLIALWQWSPRRCGSS